MKHFSWFEEAPVTNLARVLVLSAYAAILFLGLSTINSQPSTFPKVFINDQPGIEYHATPTPPP